MFFFRKFEDPKKNIGFGNPKPIQVWAWSQISMDNSTRFQKTTSKNCNQSKRSSPAEAAEVMFLGKTLQGYVFNDTVPLTAPELEARVSVLQRNSGNGLLGATGWKVGAKWVETGP